MDEKTPEGEVNKALDELKAMHDQHAEEREKMLRELVSEFPPERVVELSRGFLGKLFEHGGPGFGKRGHRGGGWH